MHVTPKAPVQRPRPVVNPIFVSLMAEIILAPLAGHTNLSADAPSAGARGVKALAGPAWRG